MEGGLHEADSGSSALVGAFDHGLHQLAADALVLRVGVDGDGADAVDDRALVKAVAAENAAIAFGHDAVNAGRREALR